MYCYVLLLQMRAAAQHNANLLIFSKAETLILLMFYVRRITTTSYMRIWFVMFL